MREHPGLDAAPAPLAFGTVGPGVGAPQREAGELQERAEPQRLCPPTSFTATADSWPSSRPSVSVVALSGQPQPDASWPGPVNALETSLGTGQGRGGRRRVWG